MKKYWKTIIWAIIILILSSIPGSDVGKIKFLNIPYMDKLAHLGLYFILCFLFVFEEHKNSITGNSNKQIILFILLACISYGIIMEFLQNWLFKERSAEFWDIVANSLGSFLAIPFFYSLKFIMSLQNKNQTDSNKNIS